MRTLSVWWGGAIVGTLQVNQHGQMRLGYLFEWLADSTRPSISFSLPNQAGNVTLAPLYDLLSTVAYPDMSPNLAMKISKRARLEEVGPSTWPVFAADVGLAAPFVRRRVAELADAVITRAPATLDRPAVAGLNVAALREFSALIVTRAERVARTIERTPQV